MKQNSPVCACKLLAFGCIAVVVVVFTFSLLNMQMERTFSIEKPFTIASSVIAALSALYAANTYLLNAKKNATELQIKLEDTFRKEILPILTWIETNRGYDEIKPALIYALGERQKDGESPAEAGVDKGLVAKLVKIEQVLRFLYMCEKINRLEVEHGTIDAMYGYWIAVIFSNEVEFLRGRSGGQLQQRQRCELGLYASSYWPTLLEWAKRLNALPKQSGN